MFSLGSKEQQPDPPLLKNQEIYNKGFELWQHYYQLHQQRIHDVDFSVGPSSKRNDVVAAVGDESSSYSYSSAAAAAAAAFKVMRQGRDGASEGINCQDCGNQAKKDCAYLRCRTCCKSRGYDCQTHVNSTWVPAAKRRERLQQQQMRENPKRMRENHALAGASTTLACCTASRLPSTTSGFELGNFPAQVNSPAVFRCVRVSAVDDTEEHYAYQTAVNIAGHVFKGILYDQGRYGGGESSSGSKQQPLDLIAAAAAAAAATSNPHITMLDPSVYPAPLNAFMAGTQFFPPPRP